MANFDFSSESKKNRSYKTKAALEIDISPISESEEDFDVSILGTREKQVCNVSFVAQADRDCVTIMLSEAEPTPDLNLTMISTNRV